MTVVLDGSGLTVEKLVRIARHGEKADRQSGLTSLPGKTLEVKL